MGKALRESVPLLVSSRLRVRIPQLLKHILLKSFYPTVGVRGGSWVEGGLSGTVESGGVGRGTSCLGVASFVPAQPFLRIFPRDATR